jgi:hypothetical protein
MKALWICLILGVAGLPCLAAETVSYKSFGLDGVLWDSASGCWVNDSVAWQHDLNLGSDCQITAATLTIDGCGIDNVWWDFDLDGGYEQTDWVDVWLGGNHLGQLTGNHTVFNLSPEVISDIAAITDAGATLTFQNDGYFDCFDTVFLKSSTLSVNCGSFGAPVAVPVPGALVLAGLGTAIVGALRRRKIA